jgi:hypothetical protein
MAFARVHPRFCYLPFGIWLNRSSAQAERPVDEKFKSPLPDCAGMYSVPLWTVQIVVIIVSLRSSASDETRVEENSEAEYK